MLNILIFHIAWEALALDALSKELEVEAWLVWDTVWRV